MRYLKKYIETKINNCKFAFRLKIRPLGFAAICILAYWLHQTKCNLRIVPPPKFKSTINSAFQRVQHLRQTQPGLFCAMSSSVLIISSFLGGSIPIWILQFIIISPLVYLIGAYLDNALKERYPGKLHLD